jgi:uncharacterized membrane protein HdeD (DUF308 family)
MKLVLLGCFLLLSGLFFLIKTFLRPHKDPHGNLNIRGVVGGIIAIVIGLLLIIDFFKS